jgi:hypothetical protein
VIALDQTVEGLSHLVAMPVAAALAAGFGVQGAAVAIGILVATLGLTGLWRAVSERRGIEAGGVEAGMEESPAWAPLTETQSSI